MYANRREFLKLLAAAVVGAVPAAKVLAHNVEPLAPIRFTVPWGLDLLAHHFKYLAVLNSDVYRGHAPGTLLTRPSAEERYVGSEHFWYVEIRLEHRQNGWDPIVLSNGMPIQIQAYKRESFAGLVPAGATLLR